MTDREARKTFPSAGVGARLATAVRALLVAAFVAAAQAQAPAQPPAQAPTQPPAQSQRQTQPQQRAPAQPPVPPQPEQQAQAQPPTTDPVVLDLVGYRVTVRQTDDGPVETFAPAVVTRPGDVIEWRLEAKNATGEPVPSVALDLPVPAGTVYVDGSASARAVATEGDPVELPAARVTFSADGGLTFGAAPLMRQVTQLVDGEEVSRWVPVPASEITHVRLTLPQLLPATTYLLVIRTEVP